MTFIILFLSELLILGIISSRLTSRLISSFPTWLYVIVFLPGTFIHELSHYLMATVLSVPVGKFSLSVKKQKEEIVLGSVSIAKVDIVRRFVVGIAPLAFGTVLILLIVYLTITNNIYSDWRVALPVGYLVFIIANSMFSSKKDLAGAWKLGVIVVVLTAGLYLLGLRIYFDIPNSEFLKRLCLYLLAPIVIDMLILIFLSYGKPRTASHSGYS